MEPTAHVYVSGRVQGIGFRFFVSAVARGKKLRGFVRNLEDGRVEIMLQGEREKIEEALNIIKSKHPLAKIKEFQVSWVETEEKFEDFKIIY